jgi:hypothetical protein
VAKDDVPGMSVMMGEKQPRMKLLKDDFKKAFVESRNIYLD